MAEDIAKLGIEINSKDILKATKRLDKLEKQSKKSEKTNKSLSGSFGALKGVVVALAGSLAIKKFFDTAGAFESMAISLEVVTGSAEKAQMAMAGITEFAKNTPFQVSEITDAFIKLKALGIEPTEASLTSFGNTSSAMGKSLNQMIEAVADASTGEFERLKEFGIKAKSQGDDVTFTFQGVATKVGKNAEEITGYLESIGREKFGGAMVKQMDTINGKISNLGDTFDQLVVTLSDGGVGTAFKATMDVMISAVTGLNTAFSATFGRFEKHADTFDTQITRIQDRINELETGEGGAGFWSELFGTEAETKSTLLENLKEQLSDLREEKAALAGSGELITTTGGIDEAGAEKEKQQSILDIKLEYDEADLERLETKYATEAELLTAKYEEENAILEEKLRVDASFQDEYNRLTLASHDRRVSEEINLEKKMQKSKIKLKLAEAAMAGAIADKAAVLMTSKNKEMFEVGKAAATASALINTYQGATKALSQGGFFGIFMAAAVVAAGIVQVSNIQSQQFGGGGGGGGGGMSMPSASMGAGSFPDSSGLSDVGAVDEAPTQQVSITLNGAGYSRDDVRELIGSINEELGDGAVLVAT